MMYLLKYYVVTVNGLLHLVYTCIAHLKAYWELTLYYGALTHTGNLEGSEMIRQ